MIANLIETRRCAIYFRPSESHPPDIKKATKARQSLAIFAVKVNGLLLLVCVRACMGIIDFVDVDFLACDLGFRATVFLLCSI
jgi:hypothetical protein